MQINVLNSIHFSIVDKDFAPVPGRFDKPLKISTVLIEPYVMELSFNITDEPFATRYEGYRSTIVSIT